MAKKFLPRLYLFAKEYDASAERIFGKENIEVIELTPSTSFDDECTEKLTELVEQFYYFYKHLMIVKNYQQKMLTMLKLSGLKYLVFKVDNESVKDDLVDWFDTYQTYQGWWDRGSEFLSTQELILEHTQSMFDAAAVGNMYNANMDIVDMKDNFENLFVDAFKDSLDRKFLMKTY